jgi:hypothetical protein
MRFRHLIPLLIFCLYTSSSLAQKHKLRFVRRVSCSNPEAVVSDLQGNFYICDSEGKITKYSSEGTFIEVFTSPNGLKPTSIEIYQGLNLLVFYQTTQEYLYLDQNFLPSRLFPLNLTSNDFASVFTQAQGQTFWIADEYQQTLKKYDVNRKQAITELSYQEIEPFKNIQITSLQSHQNRLYLNTLNSGIYVLDNFGNILKKIPANTQTVHFRGDFLYYSNGPHISFVHLYQNKEKSIPISNKKSYADVLVNDKYYFLFDQAKFDIYTKK